MNDEMAIFASVWPVVRLCVSTLLRRDVCLVPRLFRVSVAHENVVTIHCAVEHLWHIDLDHSPQPAPGCCSRSRV
jgi:hypothetical protein